VHWQIICVSKQQKMAAEAKGLMAEAQRLMKEAAQWISALESTKATKKAVAPVICDISRIRTSKENKSKS
jgi:hypothetical protein